MPEMMTVTHLPSSLFKELSLSTWGTSLLLLVVISPILGEAATTLSSLRTTVECVTDGTVSSKVLC